MLKLHMAQRLEESADGQPQESFDASALYLSTGPTFFPSGAVSNPEEMSALGVSWNAGHGFNQDCDADLQPHQLELTFTSTLPDLAFGNPHELLLRVPRKRQQPTNQMPAQRANVWSPEQWEAKKEIIRQLWIVENRPWNSSKAPHESVEAILREAHDFPVTRRQFTRKTEQWGFSKNIKEIEMQKIHVIEQKRARKSKKTQFEVRERQLTPNKLRRWRQRHHNMARTEETKGREVIGNSLDKVTEPSDDNLITYHTPKEDSQAVTIATPSQITSSLESDAHMSAADELRSSKSLDCTRRPDLPKLSLVRLFELLNLEWTDYASNLGLEIDENEMEEDSQSMSVRPVGSDIRPLENTVTLYTRPRKSLSPFRISAVRLGNNDRPPEETASWLQNKELYWKSVIFKLHSSGAPLVKRLPAVSGLAWVFFHQNRSAEAERMFRRVAVKTSQFYGKFHVQTIEVYCDAIRCMLEQGKILKVSQVNCWLQKTAKKILSSDHALWTQILDVDARILGMCGKYNEAAARRRESIQFRLGSEGCEYSDVWDDMTNFGNVLSNNGSVLESIDVYQNLLDLECAGLAHVTQADHLDVLSRLGFLYSIQTRFYEAEKILRSTVTESINLLGPENSCSILALEYMAECFLRQGKYEEAKTIGEKALRISQNIYGSTALMTINIMEVLLLICEASGEYEEAVQYGLLIVKSYEETHGLENISTVGAYYAVAIVYYNLQKYASCLEWLQTAAVGFERFYGAMHRKTLSAFEYIGSSYYITQDYEESLKWCRKAAFGFEAVFGQYNATTLRCFQLVGEACFRLQDYQTALQWLYRAKAGRNFLLGAEHADTKLTQEWIDYVEEEWESCSDGLGDLKKDECEDRRDGDHIEDMEAAEPFTTDIQSPDTEGLGVEDAVLGFKIADAEHIRVCRESMDINDFEDLTIHSPVW